mgnify:FL=1
MAKKEFEQDISMDAALAAEEAAQLRARLAELERDNANLRNAMLMQDQPREYKEYPKTMYKRCVVTLRRPHGYLPRQFADETEVAQAGPGWVDSPDLL